MGGIFGFAEDRMHLGNKKVLFSLYFARFSLSLPIVTTNQGCIGYQTAYIGNNLNNCCIFANEI